MVIHYSDKRRKKDEYNREKGLRRLRKKIKSGQLTKSNINNRGYNKFLKLEGKIKVNLDEIKIEQDKSWDGLKGYITNTALKGNDIIDNYKQLWQIEKAFRISKTDLKIRPIYHYRERRIKAHICIGFAAYTIYKELERLLEEKEVRLSVKRAAELTHNMYEIEYILPESKKKEKRILEMDHQQQMVYNLIHK